MTSQKAWENVKIGVAAFAAAVIVAPIYRQAHELGHWLPLKVWKARDLKMSYRQVTTPDEFNPNWPRYQQIIADAGGPLASQLSILAGTMLVRRKQPLTKLVGLGFAVEGIAVMSWAIQAFVKPSSFPPTSDENSLARRTGLPFQFFWLVWLILSGYMIKLYYKSIPGHKGLTILAACMGSTLGVKIWRDHIGPLVFPDETDPPK